MGEGVNCIGSRAESDTERENPASWNVTRKVDGEEKVAVYGCEGENLTQGKIMVLYIEKNARVKIADKWQMDTLLCLTASGPTNREERSCQCNLSRLDKSAPLDYNGISSEQEH